MTEKLIIQCLNELEKTALSKHKYQDYYEGNHSILKDYAMQDSRSNMKLVFNFSRKFVDNETGYFLGKPVNFVSKTDDEDIIDVIDRNISHWDKEHNINLRKESEIFGESYELDYINSDGEFCATILNPLNSYVLEDGTAERNVLLAIHKFKRQFDNKVYLDVYTENEIIHYEIENRDDLKEIGKHSHIFGRVPVIVCPANTERKSGFQDVISLFDAYNAINSDLCNEIADHRNAYLVIENAKIEEEDLLKMKSMGIIQVPKGGSVKGEKEIIIYPAMCNLKIINLKDEICLSDRMCKYAMSEIWQKVLNLVKDI